MTRVSLKTQDLRHSSAFLSKPYSVEKTDEGYEYEILTYGFEHLFSEVLLKQVEEGSITFLKNIEDAPRDGKEGYFQIPQRHRGTLQEVARRYRVSQILDLSFQLRGDLLVVQEVRPLRKLMKAKDPLEIAVVLCDVCFYGLGLSYLKKHPYVIRKRVVLRDLDPKVVSNLRTLCPSVEGDQSVITVPTFHFHFHSLEETVLYHLQYLDPREGTSESLKREVSSLKKPYIFSFYTYLRSLNVLERSFSRITNCPHCSSRKLLNPLSETHAFFCVDPFKHSLDQLKLKQGWTEIDGRVYIWTKDNDLKNIVKSGLRTLLGFVLKERRESTNCLNEIWFKDVKVGEVSRVSSFYVITVSRPQFLLVS